MNRVEQITEPRQIKLYYAPMEGIIGVHFRRVAHKHFPYVDKYYAPFVQPNQKKVFTPKEKRDILPENNDGIPLVPQVLTCAADGFIRAGKALEDYGYREININLGCPSGTVVSKGKGAGMLADAERLDHFFADIFDKDWKANISVKTRLGLDDTSDFEELLRVYRKYPIKELIIHARYRSDYYKGEPRMEQFEQAVRAYTEGDCSRVQDAGNHTVKNESVRVGSKDGSDIVRTRECAGTGICYNGNIFSVEDYRYVCGQYGIGTADDLTKAEKNIRICGYGASVLTSVMIGRGLLANPALAREIRGGAPLAKEELLAFHDDIFAMYSGMDLGEKNTLFKMKELWNYWGTIFEDADKEMKHIRKSNRFSDYRIAVDDLFREKELTENRAYWTKA